MLSKNREIVTKPVSKQVDLPKNFLAKAAGHEAEALMYMLTKAFGFTLTVGVSYIKKMLVKKNYKLIALCMAAGVQIRGNVTAFGDDVFNIKDEYPEFYIKGRTDTKDSYNFFALHVTGQILANIAESNALAKQVLEKAGDCVFGNYLTEIVNDAQAINADIAKSWSPEEKKAVTDYKEIKLVRATVVALFSLCGTASAEFAKHLETDGYVFRKTVETLMTAEKGPKEEEEQ